MTDAEICKAVAELAGWKRVRFAVPPNEHPSAVYGQDPQDDPDDSWYEDDFMDEPVPDFPNSLDAIVPVVAAWCDTHDADLFIERCPSRHPGNARFCASLLVGSEEDAQSYRSDLDTNPARALCLAFLQAVKETP